MDKKVVIIGCGPGCSDLITLRGRRAIEEADVVVGSGRMLAEFVTKEDTETIVLKNNYQDVLDEVDKIRKDNRVVFLVSGDPLLHSFGESIIKRYGQEACEVIPGISSFQYAFCRLKEGWKDYRVFSLHGNSAADVDKIFREHKRLILLLDQEHNLKFLKGKMESLPAHRYTFFAASNLSLPEEEISQISLDDFDNFPEESLSILIVRSDE